jgi:CSLREA domain-containing protein
MRFPRKGLSLAVSLVLASSATTHASILPDTPLPKKYVVREPLVANRELLFVDASVSGSAELLLGIRTSIDVVQLDPHRDGLEQILATLAQRGGIDAVHIVAHGEASVLRLGNLTLDRSELDRRAAQIQSTFQQLAPDGIPDLLFYACDLASGTDGVAFVEQIASLTGAAVAASDDISGEGGDWELELHLGSLTTEQALYAGNAADYPYRLATFTVTKTTDTDDGVCDADCSLREAIAASNLAAAGPDIITFGGVTGTITLTLGELTNTQSLEVNGPGAGSLAVSGNNASRIFDTDAPLTVRNLTLRDGDTGSDGGAIRAEGNALTIEDSIITENQAGDKGGGVVVYDAPLTILRSEITNNVSLDDGGGVGAVWITGSDALLIQDSLIDGNDAGDYGGGVFVRWYDSAGPVTIENSDITNNSTGATSSFGGGGGISVYGVADGDTVTVSNSTISDNTAYEGGGIDFYADNEGNLVVRNSTLSGNQALDDGGAIAFYSDDGTFLMENSTVSDNFSGGSGNGGGIQFEYVNGGVIEIRNSTIVNNRAGNAGGGFYSEYQDVNLVNTIVANNAAPTSPDVGIDNVTLNSTYSLIGDIAGAAFNNVGGTIVGVDPELGPLSDNGGSTLTHLPLVGSPVLNAGTPAAPALTTDQRGFGFPRVSDGRVEIGAVELNVADVSGPVGSAHAIPVLSGWLLWLLGLAMPTLELRYRNYLRRE